MFLFIVIKTHPQTSNKPDRPPTTPSEDEEIYFAARRNDVIDAKLVRQHLYHDSSMGILSKSRSWADNHPIRGGKPTVILELAALSRMMAGRMILRSNLLKMLAVPLHSFHSIKSLAKQRKVSHPKITLKGLPPPSVSAPEFGEIWLESMGKVWSCPAAKFHTDKR